MSKGISGDGAGREAPRAPRVSYDFRSLCRFIVLWPTAVGWTLRRSLVMAAFIVCYPLLEIVSWAFLLLDHLLVPGFRRRQVRAPVFIVGNFRSGTTFLHRLMSMDTARFTTMRMWEILFAPSVLQRRIVGLLAAADRLIGSPVSSRLDKVEEVWHQQNVMHEVSLREPEEDDYLLLHIWSALSIGLSSGLLGEARRYAFFDLEVPLSDRHRIMAFYHRCVQRHLHAPRDGHLRQYLAKNPALTPKLSSLLEFFPDARIVYLVRSPLEAIPSFLSMMVFSWKAVGVPDDTVELRRFLLRMARHWYGEALALLERLPEGQHIVVNYDRLVSDPEGTIRSIYDRFGFPLDDRFGRSLRAQARRADEFRSQHRYDLEALGLRRDDVVEQFRDVFERFGFATD